MPETYNVDACILVSNNRSFARWHWVTTDYKLALGYWQSILVVVVTQQH